MEIVVNRCFGGFGLSHKAIMRYAELKGITLYPEIDEISKKVYGDKATLDNPNTTVHYHTVPSEEYDKVYQSDKKKGNYEKSNQLYFSDRDIPRDDRDLIKVIRELGNKANGAYAELEIVEIPDNVDWEIAEYDGVEHIAEKHRTW